MPIKITGTGSYIPKKIVKNDEFLNRDFYDIDGKPYSDSNKEIIEKFQSITGIKERRYAEENHNTSDLATFASENAIKSAKINKEDLDYIIVAHNFGEIINYFNHKRIWRSLLSTVLY